MKVFNHFKNLGFTKKTIDSIRKEMDIDNVKSVKSVSLLLIILLCILVFFYTVFDQNTVRTTICSVSIVFLVLMYLLASHMQKHPKLCTPFASDIVIDALSAVCFAVGIYLGTFAAPNDMAVAPVWMFFFAILIFDRLPMRNLYALIAAGVVFLTCSGFIKGTHHFQYDAMHAVTSILASAYVSWYKSRLKVKYLLSLRSLAQDNEVIKGAVVEKEKEAVDLRKQANYDELTGLYKKTAFQDKVDTILHNSPQGTHHVLICIDLDYFKEINDTFGHLYGDAVLKDIVVEINRSMQINTMIGRFGGDEFMLFIEDARHINDILHSINIMETNCQKTYVQNGIKRSVSISTGYAVYPFDGVSYYDLFEKADAGLYKAKRAKKAKR